MWIDDKSITTNWMKWKNVLKIHIFLLAQQWRHSHRFNIYIINCTSFTYTRTCTYLANKEKLNQYIPCSNGGCVKFPFSTRIAMEKMLAHIGRRKKKSILFSRAEHNYVSLNSLFRNLCSDLCVHAFKITFRRRAYVLYWMTCVGQGVRCHFVTLRNKVGILYLKHWCNEDAVRFLWPCHLMIWNAIKFKQTTERKWFQDFWRFSLLAEYVQTFKYHSYWFRRLQNFLCFLSVATENLILWDRLAFSTSFTLGYPYCNFQALEYSNYNAMTMWAIHF